MTAPACVGLASLLVAAVCGLAGCSSAPSSGSPSSTTSSSTSSVAPDASPQTIAAKLGCSPTGKPSSVPAPSGSSGGANSGLTGSTMLNCTRDNLTYAIVSFTDVEHKKQTLGLFRSLAAGSGLAYCSGASDTWLVANAIGASDRLTPAQRAAQHEVMTTSHAKLGCKIITVGSSASSAAPTSAAPGAKLPPTASAQDVTDKLGCTVTSHGTLNRSVDLNCKKGDQYFDISQSPDAQALQSNLGLRRAGGSNGLQICASGLWFVVTILGLPGHAPDDPTTPALRSTQAKGMATAHAALGCTVRDI